MSRNAAIAILVAAVMATIAVGALIYLRSEQGAPTQVASVPALPADAVPYGTWALVGCQDAGGDGACRLVRRVINNDAQRVVLSFIVARGPTGNALMVIGMPPSVVIPRGVTITPGGGSAAQGAVQRCGPQLCNAVVILNDVLAGELTAAQNLALSYVAANGQTVNVNIPIAGFGEGYAAWLQRSPPPAAEANPDAADASEAPVEAPPQ